MSERRNRRNLDSLLSKTEDVAHPETDNAQASSPAAEADGTHTPSRRQRRKHALAAVAPEATPSTETVTPSKSRRQQVTDRLRRTLRLKAATKEVGEAIAEDKARNPQQAQAQAEEAPSAGQQYKANKIKYDLLDPRRYLGPDNHMRIDKDDWRELQKRFPGEKDRGRLVGLMEDIVTTNDIGPPTRMIERTEAVDEFRSLKELDTSRLYEAARTQSRYNYQSPLGLLVLLPDNTGNLTSDYLFQEIRWTCRGGRVASPEESWNDPKARRAIFHHLIDSDVPYVDRHRLRKHLGTRRYIPTPYRPSTAKALFDFIKPESVLDLSFGWGDRLAGFEASEYPKTYLGIDPDKRVLERGRKLHKLCRQTRKTVELYQSPAEDFTYEIIEHPVDMLYFAPPPFNTERYAEDDTQAYVRYTDEQAFIKEFLLKTITKAWDVLKPGGTLALDLGDLRGPQHMGGRYKLADPLIKGILRELPNATFRGTVGAAVGHHKPTSDFDTVRVDPIWIITKGHSAVARRALFGRKRAAQIDAKQAASGEWAVQ